MVLLIRIFLVSLIIYLLIRSFVRYSNVDDDSRQSAVPEDNKKSKRKISKDTGEYIEFEEDKK